MLANIFEIRPGMLAEHAIEILKTLGRIQHSVLLPETHSVADPIMKYEVNDSTGAMVCGLLVRESTGKVDSVWGSPLRTEFGQLSLGDSISEAFVATRGIKAVSSRGRDFFCGALQEKPEPVDYEIMFDDGVVTHITLTKHIPFRPGAAVPQNAT